MSARVNLLPPELATKRRARRITHITFVGLAAWLAVLGSLFVAKTAQVDDARAERDAAQTQVQVLEQQVAALDEYRVLAAQLDARGALLTASMSEEVSWARILNDLSLAFPADASMTTLDATLAAAVEPVAGEISPAEAVGDVAFNGYSVERLAPGVEGVLIDFANARGFVNTYLTTASLQEKAETEVTDFNGSVRLDENARTGRYAEGLPTEVSQ
jgi:hypothetical protein